MWFCNPSPNLAFHKSGKSRKQPLGLIGGLGFHVQGYTGEMEAITPEAAGVVKAARHPDLEPLPQDWTNTLLMRLEALGCQCMSSGCVCEQADYIRQRTAPPMLRNSFIDLARETGLDYLAADEYYRNYLCDVRTEQSSERMKELGEEIAATGKVLFSERMPLADRETLRARYNAAASEYAAIGKHIYEPLRR